MHQDVNNIPVPFRLNAFKHHCAYALSQLENAPASLVHEQLQQLCNNYIDVYTGLLTVAHLSTEIAAILQSESRFEPEAFRKSVLIHKGYLELLLSDGSRWIVREGNGDERYIHIHPARGSSYVLRFKGSTLKTAYGLKMGRLNRPTLMDVNRVREQIGLSPIRKLEFNKGIMKCYRFLVDIQFE
ncbi:hypothetical protein [Mangrovibacterium sp.]|uniref:hypothetical protein n=1 Tax=Mangrovibacterium sp. TaxID=1961364 RepID=UPI00356738D9